MGRFSRFDKLEQDRPGEAPKRAQPLARFGPEPEAPAVADAGDAPPPSATLGRFGAESSGVELGLDPLSQLPDLECPVCRRAAGKFEQRCGGCGEDLGAEAARTHNLARAQALGVARAEEAAARARQLEAAAAPDPTLRDAMEAMVIQENARRRQTDRFSALLWPVRAAATAMSVGVLLFTERGTQRTLLFVLFVVVLATVPRAVWRFLGEQRPGRWD